MGYGGNSTSPMGERECMPSLEERMSRCNKQVNAVTRFLEGMDALMAVYGAYVIMGNGHDRIYGYYSYELKNLQAEWAKLAEEHARKEAEKQED